ncbi:MAG: hypothetical protein K9N52_03570 [Verrucomicrobia bacterium]|nr:hypothetical protein [Verrucomicrobiota bacterium]
MVALIRSGHLGTAAVVIAAFLAMLLFAGCATTPKVDWDARVGSYTFDEAVMELGPPDKSAKLETGVRVCEWLTRRGYARSSFFGPTGPWSYHVYEPISPDHFLRLVFDEEGVLTDWRRYAK